MDKPIVVVRYLSPILPLESVVSTFASVCGEMKTCRLFHVPGQPANSALIEFNTKESAVIAISILDKCFLEGNEISVSASGPNVDLPENATTIGNYERKDINTNDTKPPKIQTPEPTTPTPEPEVQQNRKNYYLNSFTCLKISLFPIIEKILIY